MPAQESAWTGERVAHLVRLWQSGVSAGLIARELGPGVSRSAVIAKVHRLGLPHRSTNHVQVRKYTTPPGRHALHKNARDKSDKSPIQHVNGSGISTAPSTGYPQPSPQPPPQPSRPRYFVELGPAMCRYPLGEPAGVHTLFCAAPTRHPECSWCAHHYRLTHIRERQR